MTSEDTELVMIFETDSASKLAVAESILSGENIKYVVLNKYLQDIMAEGRIGPNYLAGPMRVMVEPQDAEAARGVLEELIRDSSALDTGRYANMRRWTARVILGMAALTLIYKLCDTIISYLR